MIKASLEDFSSIVQYLKEDFGPSNESSNSNTQSSDPDVSLNTENGSQASVTISNIEVLPKGRVRYGPVTVNPRKKPSKTLFTGRRSKYEVLTTEEEEKRRDRRERNRVAATKCREKREHILSRLEHQYQEEEARNQYLARLVEDLQYRKETLEKMIDQYQLSQANLLTSNVITHPSNVLNEPIPTLNQLMAFRVSRVTEDEQHEEQQPFALTNSDYVADDPDLFISLNQNNQQIEIASIHFDTSSLEKLMNNLCTPTMSLETNSAVLYNSAQGSTCAKQYSQPVNEDESMSSINQPKII